MYNLITRTSWQNSPTTVQLENIESAISPYPLIEPRFFEDIITLCRSKQNYFVEMGLLSIQDKQKKELNPDFWILIWAVDFKDRLLQLLIERHPEHNGKGAIAAVAPIEFFEFFSSMKQNAIRPTLTLINTPEKMKTVAIIVSRPKSYEEKVKDKQKSQALLQFQNWINTLKATPNVKGQWFPTTDPLCPICGERLLEVDGYKVGLGMRTLVCPRCGASKPIMK